MNKEQKKAIEKMFNKLAGMLGEQDAGMLIALLCDLLDKFVEGVDQREMRTIELILNDFFSIKYDFVNEKVIE